MCVTSEVPEILDPRLFSTLKTVNSMRGVGLCVLLNMVLNARPLGREKKQMSSEFLVAIWKGSSILLK